MCLELLSDRTQKSVIELLPDPFWAYKIASFNNTSGEFYSEFMRWPIPVPGLYK